MLCRLTSALYNMGLSGPKSGCSGIATSINHKTTAAEVRVWLCASGQEPGVSIQSTHDHMSGKLCVNLSQWFREYYTLSEAMLQTGQRSFFRRRHQASADFTPKQPTRQSGLEEPCQMRRDTKTRRAKNCHQASFAMSSVHRVLIRLMRMWMVLHMVLFHILTTVQAGRSSPMWGSEPHQETDAKPLPQLRPPTLPAEARQKKPKFQKRALGKAINQALREPSGHTAYRGRPCTHTELQQSRPRQRQLRWVVRQYRQPKSQTAQPRETVLVHCVTWNSNGLSGGVLEEYMLWLSNLPQQNQPQLIAIQETHWRTNAEWVTGDGWLCVASGAGERDRSAGILTMIKLSGVKQQDVRIRRVVPGRVDHIRIDMGKSSLDVLNVYQKSVSFSQSNEVYEKRSSIWRAISKVLSGLPSRNSVIIMGDLNTQLATSRPWMGPCAMLSETAEQISRDHTELLDILKRFDLTVLNSWACRRPHTYIHGPHQTLIDYIITRRSQAIGRAKQAKPVHDDSLTGWRESKHYPVFAQFSLRINHVHHNQPVRTRPYDIRTILQQDQTQASFRQQAAEVQTAADNMTLHTYLALPAALKSICDQQFSVRTDKPKPRWCDEGMKNKVRLQVSLDLSQAFDTVPWCLLEEALIRAGVPNNLREAVMTWVSSTKYLIEHRQQTIQIVAERGVRQGCGLSPLLWSMFSGLVYKEFRLAHMEDSSFPTITLFADDHHLSWILDEPGEIPKAMAQLLNFVSLLRKFGLQVNPSNSQAMLMIQGAGSDKLRQTWTYQTKIDGKTVTKLRIPGAPHSEHVTLVKQMDYLGVTLTYGRIEEITMQRRIGVAQGNFDRLRRVLNNRRVLNSQQRLGLWQATVLPSLNYGILAVGVSKLSLERYHGIVMRHIRSITNKPLHITKISNRELLQSLDMIAPVTGLIKQASTRKDNLATRWATQYDPMMHNEELWTQLCDTHDALQAHAFRYSNDGAGPIPAEPEILHKCTECGKGFATQSSLRMHISKVHTGKKKDRSIRVKDPDADVRKHGTNGMPQCRYCGMEMQRWPNLHRRITLNRCEKYLAYIKEATPLPPVPQPLVDKSEVLEQFRKSGRQFLLRNVPQWEEARTQCSICRQWIARQADLKSHLKKTHQVKIWCKS